MNDGTFDNLGLFVGLNSSPFPKYLDISRLNEETNYTANVYKGLQVLYRDIREQGCQIYEDCG